MTSRFVELLSLMALGTLWGWYEASLFLVFAGALLGGVSWLALDSWRFRQVLRWMKQGDWSNEPRVPHVWRFLVDKIRRLQKGLQNKAKDSQARLDEFLSAIQASPNGVMLLDSGGRIEWCNQTVSEHLGIDPQRDLMQHVTNLIRDPAFSSYLSKAEFHNEVAIAGAGASAAKPVVISIRIHPYGKRRRLLLSRDVTAVQQAEAMRRDFVANVSHEIRTPLTVLSGFVETLQTLPLDEDERGKYLALMGQQAERMQTLVSDLLTLSKLEGSPAPNRQTTTMASELVNRCVQEARGLSEVLAGGRHEFSIDLAADVLLAGNNAELVSALGNLLSNAVRYTPAGGRIATGVRLLPDGDVQLWVSDTGAGIGSEHIPRLTERFYRVDRSRSRETGGTGLGLAIVKHVVQRHGGLIHVESQLGVGSVFTLQFPSDRVRPLPASVDQAQDRRSRSRARE